MTCIQCLAPSLYNLIVFTITLMVVLTACGIVYGLVKVIHYERRRRQRIDSEEGTETDPMRIIQV
jgi:hypothetical protein